MNIEVTGNTILKQIQEEFNRTYPFLWINFLYHSFSESSPVAPAKIKPETFIREHVNFSGTRLINIDGSNTVTELENNFRKALNLITKVMRRSGKVWVGTSYTGNWTLDNQNYEGGQIDLD